MASLPPEPIHPREIAAPEVLAQSWSVLHRHARDLTVLAGIAPEPEAAETAITALMLGAPAWQRTLAAQGMEDIAAMLESGLAALATLSARGQLSSKPGELWALLARCLLFQIDHSQYTRFDERPMGNWDIFLNVINVEADIRHKEERAGHWHGYDPAAHGTFIDPDHGTLLPCVG